MTQLVITVHSPLHKCDVTSYPKRSYLSTIFLILNGISLHDIDDIYSPPSFIWMRCSFISQALMTHHRQFFLNVISINVQANHSSPQRLSSKSDIPSYHNRLHRDYLKLLNLMSLHAISNRVLPLYPILLSGNKHVFLRKNVQCSPITVSIVFNSSFYVFLVYLSVKLSM